MKNNRTSLALAIALASTLALGGCKRDKEVATPVADQTPMTAPATSPGLQSGMDTASVRVNSVTVGNMAAADRSVAAQSTLGTRDKIIVSVRTDGSASNAEVGARLTYQDGQLVDEETVALNTSGSEITNIEFSNTDAWPAGTYNVEVMVDGQPAGTRQQITIR